MVTHEAVVFAVLLYGPACWYTPVTPRKGWEFEMRVL